MILKRESHRYDVYRPAYGGLSSNSTLKISISIIIKTTLAETDMSEFLKEMAEQIFF